MVIKQINSLPHDYKNGKLSLEQASDKLWVLLYQNPRLFGLVTLSADDVSDFLLYTRDRFAKMILRYKDGDVPFISYVKTGVLKSLPGFLRKKLRTYAGTNSLDSIMAIREDDFTCEFDFPEEFETASPLNKTTGKSNDYTLERIKRRVKLLALHECNNLTDSLIQKIADFLEVDRDKFIAELNEIRDSTRSKMNKRELLIKRRNRAFYFKNKYERELERLEEGTLCYETTKSKMEKHYEAWKKNNALLVKSCSTSPSYALISRETGLAQKTVSYYLSVIRLKQNFWPFINKPKIKKNAGDDGEKQP